MHGETAHEPHPGIKLKGAIYEIRVLLITPTIWLDDYITLRHFVNQLNVKNDGYILLCNGHFNDTAAIVELIRFKGMPRGLEHDPIYSHVRALFGPIFLKVFLEKDCNGKDDRCAVFVCNNDRLFPEKYTVKFSFCPESARKCWASAPWASHDTP